jgi:hypothetical protein
MNGPTFDFVSHRERIKKLVKEFRPDLTVSDIIYDEENKSMEVICTNKPIGSIRLECLIVVRTYTIRHSPEELGVTK